MTIPTVYRWDDANAPVARGERASLIDILTACLVTGYGTKAAAGWTREWMEGGTKAVFRNNPVGGLGMYLMIDSLTTANTYTHNLAGYEIMADINNGTGLFTPNPNPYGLDPTIITSNVAGTTARPWVLIADDRAFYLFIWPTLTAAPGDAQTDTATMYFGDFIPRFATDGFACGLKGAYSTAMSWRNIGYYSSPSAISFNHDIIDMPRAVSGASNSPQRGWCVGGLGPCGGISGTDGVPYSESSGLIIARPYISDYGAAYLFRGYMPGLWQPCHPASALLPQLGTVTQGDDSFLIVKCQCGGASGWVLIQLSDWWA